jgi:formylglycine-generating enzyme required for sulfatase activity
MRLRAALLAAMALTWASPAAWATPPAPTGPTAERPAASKSPRASVPATWTEPLTGMVFVAVPKGCFEMGSKGPRPPGGQAWEEVGFKGELAADEKPQHQVCLDAYWIARHEVRRADWHRVMTPDTATPANDTLPMGGVSWQDAARFATLLSERASGGESFRLPTEAEWERACRAGQNEELTAEATFRTAWFGAPYRAPVGAAPVASLVPNAWGIFDMLGNVWEWVADSYAADAYAKHALYNPRQEGTGKRVMRGGSYRSELPKVRCATRGDYTPAEALPQIGFRLVMTRPAPPAKAAQ